MDLGLSDEQGELVASFTNLLAKASSPEQVRAAEPAGFDPALWAALQDIGAVTMAVPEEAGGWGASLVDLAVVAEQLGRAVAPAPVIEAQVAARLLAAAGAASDDTQLVTVALRPDLSLVPAGAVADAVVAPVDGRLVLAPIVGRTPVANLADAPLADVTLGEGQELTADLERAIDEWLVLTAAAVVGIGIAALELASAYAAERRAFGSPIGAFQGVAHPLADDATNLDGAQLLARKAAWALDHDDHRGRELAAMAFAFASTAAQKATYDALHTHGGYGFTLESDVQLFWRRARGWPRVWGDAQAGYLRAAAVRYR